MGPLSGQPETIKWEFDFFAYCTPAGKWKFRLKKAELESKILQASQSGIPGPVTNTAITGANCNKLNSIELALQASALLSMGQPTTDSLHACFGNTLFWRDQFNYNGKLGTFAHEVVHRTRGQNALAVGFMAFLTEVENYEMPLTSHPMPEEAVEAFKNGNDFKAMKTRLSRDASVASGAAHRDPEEFYSAKICGGEYPNWFQLMDQRRNSNGCQIERKICLSLPCP